MTTTPLLPLINLAEALRERDLSVLAEEKRKVNVLRDQRKALDDQIKTAKAIGADSLDWPGANARWQDHLRLKAARLQAELVQAEGSAALARERAQRSFGRAMALAEIAK
ncbi:MAG: hypothetical protein AAGM21_08435 [Pseudomonadota bacterium]